VPFISSASQGVEAAARTYLESEARASATPDIEFVALRYKFFYGPGTWYTREGDMGDQVRRQQVPIIGDGQGVYSFVHIDDAAGATAAALECPPGRTTSSTETLRLSTCGRRRGSACAASPRRRRGASGVRPRCRLLRDEA
jgi:nucleoside-diphosphate-sugar epimerase